MGKYINSKVYTVMVKTESERRSSESFFSSKEGDNFFGNVKGQTLRIVGLEHVKANGSIGAFNVVKFDDGHQMSTSKFFSARGLKWPVGGNVGKLGYIASALERGIGIEVVPQEVTSTPMKRRDGSYVGPRDEKTGQTTVAKDEKSALQAVTYHFEEQDLPVIELVDFSESAE